ncbi:MULTISPECIES: hypothetical protein [Pantoea]|uniref:hypothetical protein n=1 Tax=Pantoea TaxID=53335 RepID=UPI000BB58D40|nr:MULTISPECIES: hypothetical protein [Pantoea]PNK65153.1 hypothetical protein A6J33_021325 [Pantoea sp. FDAARGOS_194]
MNKLILKKHNESDDAQFIDLSVVEDGVKHSLFVGRVNLNEFTGWLLEHEKEIREDEIPFDKSRGNSLAEIIYDAYNKLDTDDDELVDKMYNYRSGHCLRFATRGNDFPEVYIGKAGESYEVSKFSSTESWRYPIDIDDFFCNLKY